MTYQANIILQPIEEKIANDYSILHISTDLCKKLELQNLDKFSIKCGNQKTNVNLNIIDEESHIVKCSKQLFQNLLLPIHPLQLQLSFDKNKMELILGPLIGLMVFKITPSLNGLQDYCNELEQYTHNRHGLFFIFAINEWEDHYVHGYIRTSHQWEKVKLPLPDVIYNRIPSRNQEKNEQTLAVFKTLKEKDIPIFNDHFLNKWDVYQTLSDHQYLDPYIPYTALMNGLSTLKDMILSYNSVYIKPVNGSQGRHIFRIEPSEGGFSIDYSTFSGEVEHKFPTLEDLYNSLRKRLQKERFIMQEGLDLLFDNGRPVDFRLLCHKDENGSWKVTSAVARISNPNHFVSNLSKGGEQLSLHQLLDKHFDKNAVKQIKRALYELAIEISNVISKETEGLYGEFGIDLALDQKEHIWIIEVNTKPSKRHDSPNQTIKIRPSAKAIISYCFYLFYQKQNYN